MTEENKRHNIGLEVAEAEDRLRISELSLQAGSAKTAATLAYYAAFHYARALLLMEGLESKTHGGVVHLVNLHFVRTAKLTPELGKALGAMQRDRELAEYDSASVFTQAMGVEAVRNARDFVAAAGSLLKAAGYL